MPSRIALLALGAIVFLGASCTAPPSFRQDKYDPIPGIQRGDTPEQVKAVLKADPIRREDGWWLDSNRFEMGFQVWHYRDIGRVVFNRFDMTVYASEADPR